MTGWRVGFAIGNAEALAGLLAVKSNTDTGIFKPIQYAAITGLDHSAALTAPMCDIYASRRDLVVKGLRELGWEFEPNVATFYLWLPVPPGMSSIEFGNLLLEECAIVVPPGIGYGPEGEGFFRIALTQPEARLQEALDRMKAKNILYRQEPAKASAL